MIQFDNEECGRELRRCHPQLSKSFPGLTPIKKQILTYPTGGKAKGARYRSATLKQFPVIICFASTTHKIQGQTIIAPRKAAIDLRTVFGSSQAYVMMGRVQQKEQLYIIGSLPRDKIYVDNSALKQLETMREKSLNNNKPTWEDQRSGSIRVYFQNIQSIRDKIEDIKADNIPFFADVLIFSETWLEPSTCSTDPELVLNNYSLSLNSEGRGKGLAVFFKESMFQVTRQINKPDYQMSKLESENFTVITLYRSQTSRDFAEQLIEMIPLDGDCLVIGDMNICSKTQSQNDVFSILRTFGFMLLINEATHLKGGHIDQAWLRTESKKHKLSLYSPYYTCRDHDALLFTLLSPAANEGKF